MMYAMSLLCGWLTLMEKLGQKWEGPYILMRRKNTCAIFMYISLSMDIFRIIDSTTSSSEDVVLLFIMQLDVKIK